MVISFFGHRDFSGTSYLEHMVFELLTECAKSCDILYCYTGGYGAFDRFAADCVKRAQKYADNIKSCLILPYLTPKYCDKIKRDNANVFDEFIYPPIENVSPKYAVIRRNEWMAAHSDLLIVYVKYSWGGAARIYNFAVKNSIKFLIWQISDYQ